VEFDNKTDAVTHVTDPFDINVTRARTREGITKASDTSVTRDQHRHREPARRMMKPTPEHETEAIKRYGWLDQGVLVVNADDTRLSWPERELVRQLGSRLYGRTPREDR
jgi:hypothetical protein